MADAYLDWGGDLQLSPSGDLLLVDQLALSEQRIIRRLYTAVRAYIWHQDFGAGLPQKIGRLANVQNIAALIRANIALEDSVASFPPAQISVTKDPHTAGLFVIGINYTDANLGQQVSLSFDTTNAPANSPLYLG